MSTSTLRASRWLCVALVSLLGLATFAPMAALADTDLTIGGTAVVANSEGAGAALRSSPGYDAEVLLTVPEGSTVSVSDGPTSAGGALWYGVTYSDEAGFLPAIYLISDSDAAVDPDNAETDPDVEASATATASTDLPTLAAAETGTAVIVGTNGDGVRCRTEPSYAGAVINVIPEGASISLNGAVSEEWQPTSCDGNAGFVHTDFVSYDGETPEATTAPVEEETSFEAAEVAAEATGTSTISGTNGDGVRCRSDATYSAYSITVLPEGAGVSLRGEVEGEWQPVICAGTNGFVHASFVGGSGVEAAAAESLGTATGSATVSGFTTITGTNGDGVRCRSAADYNASTITVLLEGTSVAMSGPAQAEWQPVICAGMSGFAHTLYTGTGGTAAAPSEPQLDAPVADAGGATVSGYTSIGGTNGDGVRCRSAADYNASTITVLPEGTSLPMLGDLQGEWQPVVCASLNGFVHALYVGGLETAQAAPEAASIQPPAAPTQPAVPETTPAPAAPEAATAAPTAAVVATAAPAPATQGGIASGAHAQIDSSLNLRYEPNYNSGVAAVAEGGTVVEITGAPQNGFYPVNWDGLSGFMSGEYLVVTNAALSERGGSATQAPLPAAPAAPAEPAAPAAPEADAPSTASGGNGSIAGFALQYQGYPYVWATSGPASFDCSGFTYWVIKNTVGIDIGRGLFTQAAAGTPVSRGDLQPGDLVFFQNTYTWGLSHAGVYIGNGQFIHAENETTGVKISDINSDYYSSRWYGAVRF